MKKSLMKKLSLGLAALVFAAVACEPPAEEASEATPEVAAEAVAKDEKAEPAQAPVEAAELPDQKQRMAELLKMEQESASAEINADNADEIAAQLEAEIEADLE
ncbi:hypothetical protein [Bradymonas sediminis]|uniref:Uncharacterized protein n=1 Tax=Bradymonas sediminis TaxID=1548548 RepID=A0A2Z4FJH8_9DELT|nr:hypothetical protein [Bradymonas sediminis]AWV89010.1 hypothetical protein DN745_06525 [Bradymonas sediminis]TDP64532.1 hypothetical protein DFR33_109196 [Bradymonas sediminis]